MRPRWTVARFLAQFRKRNLEQELEDEILAHLELAESEGIAAGLSPEKLAGRHGAVSAESHK